MRSILRRAVVLWLLIDVAFVFLVPLLQLFSTSLMSVMDFYDPTVMWIPKRLAWENYHLASLALDLARSSGNTILVAGSCAICRPFLVPSLDMGLRVSNFQGGRGCSRWCYLR